MWGIFTSLINLVDCGIIHLCLIPRASLIYSCHASWGFKFINDHTLSCIGSYHLVSKQGSSLNFLFYVIFLSYEKKTIIFQCLLVLCFILNFVCFIVRSKIHKVVSNLVEFFLFCIFFSVLGLNCVFLHLICGNYLFLCLGFASAVTLIYMSMRVWRINCLVLFLCWIAKKKYNKTKIVDQSQKETNIYWKKRIQKKGSSTQLFVAILFVVYWYLVAISLSRRVFVLSPLNLFGSPIIFYF